MGKMFSLKPLQYWFRENENKENVFMKTITILTLWKWEWRILIPWEWGKCFHKNHYNIEWEWWKCCHEDHYNIEIWEWGKCFHDNHFLNMFCGHRLQQVVPQGAADWGNKRLIYSFLCFFYFLSHIHHSCKIF